jgi:hypothetical protein
MTDGRGGDEACISKEEGRRHGSVEGRLVGDAALAVRRQWRVKRWEMTWLG